MRRVQVTRPRAVEALRTFARPVARPGPSPSVEKAGLSAERLARALGRIEPALRRSLERRAEAREAAAPDAQEPDVQEPGEQEATPPEQGLRAAGLQGTDAQAPVDPRARAPRGDEAATPGASADGRADALSAALASLSTGLRERIDGGASADDVAGFVRGHYGGPASGAGASAVAPRDLDALLVTALDGVVDDVDDPAIVERLLSDPRPSPDGDVPAIGAKGGAREAASALLARADAAAAERAAARAVRAQAHPTPRLAAPALAEASERAAERRAAADALPEAVTAILRGDGDLVAAGPLREQALALALDGRSPDEAAQILRMGELVDPSLARRLRRAGRAALIDGAEPSDAVRADAAALGAADPLLLEQHVVDPRLSELFDLARHFGGDAPAFREASRAAAAVEGVAPDAVVGAARDEARRLVRDGPAWRSGARNADSIAQTVEDEAERWARRGLDAGEAAAFAERRVAERATPVRGFAVRRPGPGPLAPIEAIAAAEIGEAGADPADPGVAFLPTVGPAAGWAPARVDGAGARRIGPVRSRRALLDRHRDRSAGGRRDG